MEHEMENPRKKALEGAGAEELGIWEEITRLYGDTGPLSSNVPFHRSEIMAEITRRREEKEDRTTEEPFSA